MKVFKRFMALVLCLAMTLTLFVGLTFTASAASVTYTEVSFDDLTTTDTFIVTITSGGKTYLLNSANGTSATPKLGYTGTISANSCTFDEVPAVLWKLDASKRICVANDTGKWVYTGTSNNALRVGTSTSGNTWTKDGDCIKSNANRYLSLYSTTDFRSYTSKQSGQVTRFFKQATSYTVNVASNNNSFGTVAYSNNTITATPASGYYVTGDYTVNPSGAATVAYNNDNTFAVSNITANCTITVNFAQKQTAALTYSENGTTHNHTGTSYVGDTITLAAPTGAAPAGYTFMGWLPNTYADDTAPTGLLQAGDNYTLLAASNTLYAVYAVQSGSGGSGNEYRLVTAAKNDWSGTYVIADKNSGYVLDYATSTTAGNASTVSNADITLNSGVMTNVAERYTVTLGKTGNNYYVKLNGATSDTYLNLTANSNTVGKGNSYSATTGQWTVTWDTDGVHLFNASYTTRELQKNNSGSYFRCYTGTQTDIVLYEQQAGVTYSGYTTSVNQEATYYTLTYSANPAAGGTIDCDVASASSVEEGEVVMLTAIPAEHYTFDGWTVDGILASDYEADGADLMLTMNNNVTVTANFTEEATYTVTVNQPAIGGTISASKTTAYAGETITLTATQADHYSFTSWTVNGATLTEATAASTSFTMPAANVTVTASFTEDAKYTVTFYDTDTHAAATKEYYTGETIPAADVPTVTAPEGFVFKGWYNATYNNTTAPAYVTPAGTTVENNLTFRAVYAELSAGGTSETFKLLLNDTYVGGRTGSNDFFDEAATEAAAVEIGIEEAGGKSFLYYLDGSAKVYFYNTSDSTSMTFSGTLPSNTSKVDWTVTETSSSITFQSKGSSRYLGYNSGSSRFSTYVTSYPHQFTKVGGASIEGYTTNPVATKITVTWMNGTETFRTERVEYGTAIAAPATNPEKTEAEQEYYTFAGWSETEGGAVITSFPTASAQLGDKTYYAVFTTVSKLTVTWNNYDNTNLATEYYKAGETPTYKGEEPTKPATSSFYYTFSGWNPTVSPVTAAITYTATFEQHDRFELTASLAKASIKAGRSTRVNYTLTDKGEETNAFTPTFTTGNSAIATVDATGKVTAVAVGTTTVTITFVDALDSNGRPLTVTMQLEVVEAGASSGYTLITQDNAPTDWSGDYIIMGKPAGDTAYMNDWMILTPNYDGGSVKIAANNEDAATVTLTDDGSGIGTGTINDEGNASSGVDKNITMEDTGLVTDLNDDDSILVYDTVTEIDDAYAFTVECIDDINQIYTIRVKDTSLYIACSASTSSGNNSLNFDSAATELAQWRFSVQRVTKGGYNNDIIAAQNVGNSTRRLYFNSNSYGGTNGQFRDYYSTAYANLLGGNESGAGQAYNLYLFGNPNPFKAQIYYHGNQVTLVDTAEVPINAATAQLTSALMPDIAGYPNWQQVGEPTWSIIENSTGNHMAIAQDGTVTLNSSTVGSFALVQVSYTVRDLINNTDLQVSTVAKIEVIASSQTYSTVIYETYSGADTEVQYTVNNSVTELPLSAYVVNDITNANSKDGGVVMGGSLSWTAVKNSGNTQATVSIGADGVLQLNNFTADGIVTVTASGATGDNVNAAAGTFKVYVKAITYQTAIINATNATTGTYDADTDTITYTGTETNGNLAYNVRNQDNQGPGANTFSLYGGAWSISGDSCGATINSAGYLDFTNVDRSENHTITVLLSSLSATANGVTTTNLSDTITVVIEKQTVEQVLEAVNDTVLIDWALPVTFDVTKNDNCNVTFTVSNGTLPTGVASNNDGTFTYTPSFWQTTDQTFTYTLSGTVNGTSASSTATVTLKTADSVYYEDTYSDIFTFTGAWSDVTDGDAVGAQTSSLDTADIFEYDANYAEFAKYSGGTARKTTVSKGDRPTVTFTFAGTGFDIISATTRDTGAIKLTVTGAGFEGINKILDTFRGYTYVEEAYTRYGLKTVERFKPDGESYIKYNADTATDALSNYSYYFDTETSAYVENTVWYSGDVTKYYDNVNNLTVDADGFCILKEYTSHWQPAANGEGTDYYQIPILKVTDLPYGTYTVTITPTYTAAFDRVGDGSYDFYFDGVRIHNPVANREAEYKYINIRDAVAERGFGSGTVVECDHEGQQWSDWTFYSRARNTASATTNNRGAYVRYCNYCGGVADTAYFHVNVTANATQLGVGGYNNLPATTVLHYTLTADAGTAQAAIQAKLDAIQGTLTEYWSSNTAAVLTCTNNTNLVIANGAGTTYATLQLKDPATQTIYASAIHSPDITVSEDTTHVHSFGNWAHIADSEPSTHTRTCTDADCSFFETEACSGTSAVMAPTCTAGGYTTYICSKCSYEWTGEETAALNHDYGTATSNNDGSHSQTCSHCNDVRTEGCTFGEGVVSGSTVTYTCTACDYSYSESIEFDVSYSVPTGVTYEGYSRNGNSVTLPSSVTIPATYNAHNYSFVGWSETHGGVTTTEPANHQPGATVPVTDDTVFYPVFCYGGGSTSSEGYSLSNAAPADGDTVILARLVSGTYYAMTNAATPASSALNMTGNAVNEEPAGSVLWTVEGAPEGVYLKSGSNYLHMNSSALKVTTQTTNGDIVFTANGNGSFKATRADGSRYIVSSGTNGFSCSATEANAVEMYVFKYTVGSGSGATTYTFTLESADVTDTYTATVNGPSTLSVDAEATYTVSVYHNNVLMSDDYLVEWSNSNSDCAIDNDTGYYLTGSTAGTDTITATVLAGNNEEIVATKSVTIRETTGQDITDVTYVKNGNYVYNWGTKGVTVTGISPMASEYYTGSYSYDILSAQSGDTLYNTLRSMIGSKSTKTTSYDDCKNYAIYTDCQNSDGNVYLLYTNYQTTLSKNSASAPGWNREHVWPKSLGGFNTSGAGADILHIRPDDVTTNADRGNKKFGEVTGGTASTATIDGCNALGGYYSSGVYEPNDDTKGDVARIVLYLYTYWLNKNNYPLTTVFTDVDTLLSWCALDPVDTFEIGRNDAAESICGRRNPFVDYPELAWQMLDESVPASVNSHAVSNQSAFAGTAESTVQEVKTTAKRSIPVGGFDGAVIIDGKGESNVADDFEAYGPEHGVYLAPGQGIVFSLTSSDTSITAQNLQIGAKAVNGTATSLDVASVSNGNTSTGIKYLLSEKPIASATEMYYDLDTTQMGWTNGESSVLVIYNSGEGVLDVTNLRYCAANGNTLTMNINEVQAQRAAKMLRIVYGVELPPVQDDATMNIESVSLILNGKIDVGFHVTVPDGYENTYMVINGETVTERTERSDGTYRFLYKGINPQCMGDSITATLYGTDRNGVEKEISITDYSIRQYCVDLLKNDSISTELRTLVSDMLVYGAAAQNYTDHNADTLVNAGNDILNPQYSTFRPLSGFAAAFEGTADNDYAWTSANLTLTNSVAMNFRFYAVSVEGLAVKATVKGRETVFTAADFKPVEGEENVYEISFAGISAEEFAQKVTAEFAVNGTKVGNTVCYSVNAYIQAKQNSNDAALRELVSALYNYGASAAAYAALANETQH